MAATEEKGGSGGIFEGENAGKVTPIGGFAIELDTLGGNIQRALQSESVLEDIGDGLRRDAIITDFDQRVTIMETEVSDSFQRSRQRDAVKATAIEKHSLLQRAERIGQQSL